MKVWLHSDDAGATSSITTRILSAWNAGLLDSFSIITNGDACDQISQALNSNKDRPVRLSVHLNLSEGKTTLSKGEASLIADQEGTLHHTFGSLLLFWILRSSSAKQSLLQQIRDEWRNQIRTAKQLCGPRELSGVDSHNHVHMLPFLFPVAAELCREEQIPAIRLSREPFFISSILKENLRLSWLINLVKHFVLNVCARFDLIDLGGFGITGYEIIGVQFTGMMSPGAVGSALAKERRNLPKEIEVVVHVGRASQTELGRWKHLPKAIPYFVSEWRDREFNNLPSIRKAISDAV